MLQSTDTWKTTKKEQEEDRDVRQEHSFYSLSSVREETVHPFYLRVLSFI